MLRSGTVFNTKLSSPKMEFSQWKETVDTIVFNELQMHCQDLPDEDYWMHWHKNTLPNDMASMVIKNTNEMTEFFKDLLNE